MTDQWRLETHFRDRFPYDGSLTPQVPGSHVHVTARSSERVYSALSQTETTSLEEELLNTYFMQDDKISHGIILKFLRNPNKIQKVSLETLNLVFQGFKTSLDDGDTVFDEIQPLIAAEFKRRNETQGNIFTRG